MKCFCAKLKAYLMWPVTQLKRFWTKLKGWMMWPFVKIGRYWMKLKINYIMGKLTDQKFLDCLRQDVLELSAYSATTEDTYDDEVTDRLLRVVDALGGTAR